MIRFKLSKQNLQPNTFIAKRTTCIDSCLNAFGFIKRIDKKGIVIVDWYYNFIKSEIKFKLSELKEDYKSILPYYNTKFLRGNIWKYSYTTLLNKIHPEKGFSQIKVDKMTYKMHPIKGNNVIITDAVYVLSNKITKLEGKIVNINKKEYSIKTKEGVYVMNRNSFAVLPQDYFILLSIRCN